MPFSRCTVQFVLCPLNLQIQRGDAVCGICGRI